ncbi:MAG: right-handed parallel beta-helix repeat-containing protein [Phycisphaerae bacterium]|nr:right-handed parallel beta-helix repeat-containing protein [Phycisphaerae bacterium]
MKSEVLAFGVLTILLASHPLPAKTITATGTDTPAIEAAIAQSNTGDTVFLPEGTYTITKPVAPKSKTCLRGAGRDETILRFVADKPAPMIVLANCDDVELCHLALDGANNANAAQGISAANARRLNLHHLTIRNLVKGQGFGPHGILFSGANPSKENGVTDSVISDCRIENVGIGAKFGGAIRLSWGSSRNQVLRCTIDNTGRGGIFADNGSNDLVIRHNTVTRSGGEGLGIEVWGHCDRAVIEDNRIDHWLSVGGCNLAAVRRNVISDKSGTYKFCGIEGIGSYLVITDNLVDGGQKIGLSVSAPIKKDYVLWARNTVKNCNQWAAQFQGDSTGIACHYLYQCKFVETPIGKGPVWYPGDEGHGFRANGNNRNLTFEDCEFARNGRLGLQLIGKGIDALSFLRCAIKDNKGPAVLGPSDYTALEWVDCTATGSGGNTLPPARPFKSPPPVASFEAPDKARAGQPVDFVSTSRAKSGKIRAILWDFGDGPPCIDAKAIHTYHAPGPYRVTLIVWDEHGRAARAEKCVVIKR